MKRILGWIVGIFFFTYWIFTLQNDFKMMHRLQNENRRLTYLQQEETVRTIDLKKRLQSLSHQTEWDRVIRRELRYVRKGEILVRPVRNAPVVSSRFWSETK